MAVLCIVAFAVFAVMSIFSARHRPLAKEAFGCVFRTITLRPCDSGMDERIKAEIVGSSMKVSPHLARAVNSHYALISWAFVILTFASFAFSVIGIYNFYYFGNCDGPGSFNACIINDLTGDYGRFSQPTDMIPPTDLKGITYGNSDADVIVIEFGCFTCPYTAQAGYTMDSILEAHKDEIFYVFKPFPIPSHENSYEAARGVLCAHRQDRHWELQRLIFQEQMVCTEEGSVAIRDLASQAGLDMGLFNACFDGHQTDAELDMYVKQGIDARIYATPTFFINGRAVVGPVGVEEFEAILEEAKAG